MSRTKTNTAVLVEYVAVTLPPFSAGADYKKSGGFQHPEFN